MRYFAFQKLLRLCGGIIVVFAVSVLFGFIDRNSARSIAISNNSDLYNNGNIFSELSMVGAMLQGVPVQCQTFDDGYSRMSGLSDAIYAQGNSSLCTPGSGAGTCRKWFGRCTTVGSTRVNVLFRVHDNGDANQTGLSDAVYMNKPDLSCIPDGTSTGNCKRWFGLPQTQDGRPVTCRLFNDGYTNMTAPTRSIYYNSPGKVCMPDGSPEGTCRKWFGRCEVAPSSSTCTSFTYSAWSACQPNGTQTRTVLSRLPSGCSGGQPITTQSCVYPSSNRPEQCFGAVGSQCDGVAIVAPRQNLQNGLVRLKISVGSIAHDTCCARNPDGKWCGKYQEVGHNGQCDKEWNKAYWNSVDGRMWDGIYDPTKYADTALVSNPRSATFDPNYKGGGVIRLLETVSTRILSAPRGTALDVGDEQFCSSGRASGPMMSLVGKRWIVCQ